MRNLIIFGLMLFLVASISLDAFADTSPTPDHDTIFSHIGDAHVGATDLIPSLEVNYPVILIITDTEIVNRDNPSSISILSDFILPIIRETINRSDCNYPTTSFLPIIVRRSYSEISTRDYSQRNTNVVPIDKNIFALKQEKVRHLKEQ